MGLGALERGAGSFVVHRQSKGDVVALQRSSGAAGRRASTPRSAKSPERSDLALGDREDDHDLVRPGGMDRQVDRRDVREGLLHRSIERLPLCEEPLSTTKWTRRALLQGSVDITLSTRPMNGSMPVCSAPRRRARPMHAYLGAEVGSVPPGRCSNSTRRRRPGAASNHGDAVTAPAAGTSHRPR